MGRGEPIFDPQRDPTPEGYAGRVVSPPKLLLPTEAFIPTETEQKAPRCEVCDVCNSVGTLRVGKNPWNPREKAVAVCKLCIKSNEVREVFAAYLNRRYR